MDRKVLIGTVIIDSDMIMYNNQFQYAASFETLKVPAGEYPIYSYENDILRINGKAYLGWRNYIGYEGMVMEGNVGGRPGDKSYYHQIVYDNDLAALFLNGHEYMECNLVKYKLRPELTLTVNDFNYDDDRFFSLRVVLKDGEEFTYM